MAWAAAQMRFSMRIWSNPETIPGSEHFRSSFSCRAFIRVHVTMSMAHAKAIGLKAAEKDAVALLDCALAYFQPPRRRLIAVGGVSGTGNRRLPAHWRR